MKLYIKYMVTRRCKMLVEEEFIKQGLRHIILDFGTVEVLGDISQRQRAQLRLNLRRSGMEVLDDKESILIEKIYKVLLKIPERGGKLNIVNYADYISKKLNCDYTYLDTLFSEVKGIAIQQFVLLQRIERIKDLLLCKKLNIKQIAYKLHCSAAHLSSQFKKVTGLSPSAYQQLKQRFNA